MKTNKFYLPLAITGIAILVSIICSLLYFECNQPLSYLAIFFPAAALVYISKEFIRANRSQQLLNEEIKKMSHIYLLGSGSLESELSEVVDLINQMEDPDYGINSKNKLDQLKSRANNGKVFKSVFSLFDKYLRIEMDEQKRNWVNTGLARFVEILRTNQQDINKLPESLISSIVKYTNSNQGALFLLENDVLELKSCYAYNKKKFINKCIQPGDGLVGQAFLEKETIYMTEVPKDYVTITSGLGEALPTSILIVPLKLNDEVLGVLELASFNEFEKFQVEFLEKIGESIASTISIASSNAKTRKLLKESLEQEQRLKEQEEELRQNMEELVATQENLKSKSEEQQQLIEELRAQEEELRQNMEELQAIQEELEEQFTDMKKLKAEMEARENVLNMTTIVSESDLYGNITYVNDKFLEVTGFSKEELIGKPHSTVRHPDMPKEVFKTMWSTIKSGKPFRGIVKNRKKNGSHYWVDATISPVLNDAGKPEKYIGIRYVIPNEELARQLFEEQLMNLKSEVILEK